MNRRSFLRNLALGAAGGYSALLAGCVSTEPQPEPGVVKYSNTPDQAELISDPHFLKGFQLVDPEARTSNYGIWCPFFETTPVWKLAQWHTIQKLSPNGMQRTASRDSAQIANDCKAVTVTTPEHSRSDLILEVLGNTEYQGTPRAGDEPWVHLLVEQAIETKPRLVDLTALNFHLEARLLFAKLYKPKQFDETKHAAQYQVFFYLQDTNRKSEGYGEMIWFGVPVYDNREWMTDRYEAADFAGSGMFICTLAHEDVCPDSAHGGKWITLEADLLPQMKEAFSIAQKKGFMQKTKSLEDIRLTGMNMGWEVPGLLDVSLQTRNLSLRCES
jgi:hypothetical protein